MTERDTDIEFDFFEDLEPPPHDETTDEAERPRPRRGPPRRPGGPGGPAPLFRLAGLIAFAILVVVLLVFWVDSCRGAGKRDRYKSYMEERVGTIARNSEAVARDLNEILTTRGLKAPELQQRLVGLAQQEEQNVGSALEVSPPGPLRDEHQNMVEALQFRVSGLRGLADAFGRTAGSKDVAGGGLLLAAQAQRLVTSDVVWDDLFKDAAVEELKNQGVTGVAPPDSNFVTSPDFAGTRYWVAVLERLRGVTTGTPTGLHGSGLISVKTLPSEQVLDPNQENTVTATTDLGFVVTVENTGDSQEVQVKVTLTIQQQPEPIVKSQTIPVINAGEQKTVTFRNLGQVQFATKTVVKVDIAPVPGERNTSNNSAQYPVIFSLG